MSQPDVRWLAGSTARPQDEAKADRIAQEAVRSGRIFPTVFCRVAGSGAIRCRACGGRAFRDVDEVKCLMCGRTLIWIGLPPILQEDAPAELAHEKSSDHHRRAAQARWNGKAGHCLQGHAIEGDNVMTWGDRRRCRGCYLRRHQRCPKGHEYTPENIRLTSSGRRRCVTCDQRRKRVGKSRQAEVDGAAAERPVRDNGLRRAAGS